MVRIDNGRAYLTGPAERLREGDYRLIRTPQVLNQELWKQSGHWDQYRDHMYFTEVEENITFQLRFPGGVLANCTSSYGAGLNRFRVVKPRGSAELDPALSYTGLRMRVFRGNAIEERVLPQRDQFALEMDHFAGCVLDNTEPLTPGDEGLKDLKVMMAIYEAARSGRSRTSSAGARLTKMPPPRWLKKTVGTFTVTLVSSCQPSNSPGTP